MYQTANPSSWGLLLVLLSAISCFGQTASAPATPPRQDVPGGVSAVPDVAPATSPLDMLKRAAELFQQGDHEKSMAMVSSILAKDAENVDALALRGGILETQAAAARTRNDNTQYEQLIRAAVQAYLQAAPIALAVGREAVAEQMYRRILAYSPKNPQANVGLARILASTSGGEMLAIERYREYLKMPVDEQSAGAGTNTGRRRTYADVDSRALLDLGRLYRQAKYFGQAIATLTSAQQINPEDPEIYIELARAYYDNSGFEKAKEAAEKAIGKAPQNPEYYGTLAAILLAKKDLGPAATTAEESIKTAWDSLRGNRDNQNLLRTLDQNYRVYQQILLQQLGQPKASADIRLKLMQAIKDHSSVQGTLSLYQALRVLSDAPIQERDTVPMLEALAQTQLSLDKLVDAAASCRRLRELDANNAVAARVSAKLPPDLVAGAATRPADR